MGLLSKAKSSVSRAANSVKSTVSKAANSVSKAASSVRNTASTAAKSVSSAASSVRSAASSSVSSVKNSVSSTARNSISTARDTVSNTVSHVSDAKTSIQNSVGNIGSAAHQAVNNTVKNVSQTVSNTGSQAQQAAQRATTAAQQAAQRAADQAASKIRAEQAAAQAAAAAAQRAAAAEAARIKAEKDKVDAAWNKKQQDAINKAIAAKKSAQTQVNNFSTSVKSSVTEQKQAATAAQQRAGSLITSLKSSASNSINSIKEKAAPVTTSIKNSPSILLNPVAGVSGIAAANILPSISMPKVTLPSVSIPNTIVNAGSSVSSSIDKFYNAKEANYGVAVDKIRSGEKAEGSLQFGGTLALDMLLPLDAIEVGNKLATGRANEISKEDMLFAGLDVVTMIPTPFTALGGKALKTSMMGLKVVEEGSKATKTLKAADTANEGFYAVNKATKAGDAINGKTAAAGVIAGGLGMGKLSKFSSAVKALTAAKDTKRLTAAKPILSLPAPKAGTKLLSSGEGAAKVSKSSLSGSAAASKLANRNLLQTALKGRSAATAPLTVNTGNVLVNKGGSRTLVNAFRGIDFSKEISDNLVTSFSKTTKVNADKLKTLTAGFENNLKTQQAAASQARLNLRAEATTSLQKALASREAYWKMGETEKRFIKNVSQPGVRKSVTKGLQSLSSQVKAASVLKTGATAAAAGAVLKGTDEVSEAGYKIVKGLASEPAAEAGYRVLKVGDDLADSGYSIGKATKETSVPFDMSKYLDDVEAGKAGKSFETGSDISKGYDLEKAGDAVKGTKAEAEAVKGLSTLDKAKKTLSAVAKPVLAGLAATGLYSMLTSDMAKTFYGDVGETTGAKIEEAGKIAPENTQPPAPEGDAVFGGGNTTDPGNNSTDPGNNSTSPGNTSAEWEAYKKAMEEQQNSFMGQVQQMFDDLNKSLSGADTYYDDLQALFDAYKAGTITPEQFQAGLDAVYAALGQDLADGKISQDEYAQYEDAIQALEKGDPTLLNALEPDFITKVWNWICTYWLYIAGALIVWIVIKSLYGKASSSSGSSKKKK